ncbi:ArsC/Spx/MgsR family protein [Bacillus mycoides]|uniref:Arsenate reductase and related n=1 Tax=Bacillus mycoides (strain KBAB4) TaxID=315730 RepID=A9VUU5_BACMK|nr:ArsC/Spx/MgsR family protein [Bacillus mycoides]ABY46666.1 arsenate reductase and related [Bacillus mycoides KBAB4]
MKSLNITIYTINSAEGERVAEKLAKYDLMVTNKHIVRDRFTFTEFKALLALTDNGLDDLLTQRGSTIDFLTEQGIDLDDLTLREAYNVILQNPKLLKTTILTDWNRIAFGLNGTKMFLPRHLRKQEQRKMYLKPEAQIEYEEAS